MDNDSMRFVPIPSSTYVLTASGYEDRHLMGSLYCPRTERTFAFRGLMQFLLLMEALMDETRSPQRNMELRVNPSHMELLSDGAVPSAPPVHPLASFEITVLFRQNASWQGVMIWNEGGEESPFRSVLELSGLLDDALFAAQANAPRNAM